MSSTRTEGQVLSCDTAASFETDPAGLVATRLQRSGYPFLRRISCEFNGGLLTLSGIVPTFHLKQLAQELAAHTPGVRQVNNGLHVTNPAVLRRAKAAITRCRQATPGARAEH